MDSNKFILELNANIEDISGWIFKKTYNSTYKDEIISLTILRLWKNRNRIRENKFRQMFRAYAKNNLLDFFRAEKKQKNIDKIICDNNKYPIESLSKDVSRIRLIIPYLANRQKQAIELRICQSISIQIVSEIMKISRTTVVSLIESGIKRLKSLWKVFEISPDISKIDLLTTKEVAKELKMSSDYVLNLIKKKKIQAILVGKTMMIDRSWLKGINNDRTDSYVNNSCYNS